MGLQSVRGPLPQQNCVGSRGAQLPLGQRTSVLRRVTCDWGAQSAPAPGTRTRNIPCHAIIDTGKEVQELESVFTNSTSATSSSSSSSPLSTRSRPTPLWDPSLSPSSSSPSSPSSRPLNSRPLNSRPLTQDGNLSSFYNLHLPNTPLFALPSSKPPRKMSAEEAQKQRRLQRIKYYEQLSKLWLGQQGRKHRSAALPPPDPQVLQLDDPKQLLQHYQEAATNGHLQHALDIVRRIVELGDRAAVQGITHKTFLHRAAEAQDVGAAISFLEALPAPLVTHKTFNLVLSVCTRAGDVRAALGVAELAQLQGIRLDPIHYTNLINACGRAGNVERAIKVYNELKQQKKLSVDMHVYSSLITTFTRAIQLQPPSNRKQQLVLLERAFDVLDDALGRGMNLSPAVWSSLVACAAACAQLERAFQVVDLMQTAGCKPTVETYGALMDVCIRTKQQRLALQLFKKALKEGCLHSVRLYTQALSACMLADPVTERDLSRALDIYRIMRSNGVEPDDVLYGHLIALAGKASRPDIAFGMLRESLRRQQRPSTAICSSLISTCLRTTNHYTAMLVYRLLRKQGVYPSLQQYNNLLAAFSTERRLGEVVSLVKDLVEEAKLTPNSTTFGILLDACEKTDQAELAFEILTVMKGRGMDIGEVHFWHISKICFNRIRFQWYPPATPPGSPVFGPITPSTSPHLSPSPQPYIPVVRTAEALSLLEGLGSSMVRRRPGSFLEASESVNWATRALAVYRDAVSSGLKPSPDTLDRVLACLRWQHKGEAPQEEAERVADAAFPPPSSYLSLLPPMSGGRERPRYELPFDKRAFAIMEEAISLGSLPAFTPDSPSVIDLRLFRPTLAEVYMHYVFMTLEKRGISSHHRAPLQALTLLVPPWDPNLVMWPSYVEKLNKWEQPGAQEEDDRPQAAAQKKQKREKTQGDSEGQEGEYLADEEEEELHEELEEEELSSMHSRAKGTAQAVTSSSGAAPSSASSQATAGGSTRERRAGNGKGLRHKTGLAVAATLKRLRLQHVKMDCAAGVIQLEARDIAEWVLQKARYNQQQQKLEEAEALSALPHPSPRALNEQRRSIRMGMGPNPKPQASSARFQEGRSNPPTPF